MEDQEASENAAAFSVPVGYFQEQEFKFPLGISAFLEKSIAFNYRLLSYDYVVGRGDELEAESSTWYLNFKNYAKFESYQDRGLVETEAYKFGESVGMLWKEISQFGLKRFTENLVNVVVNQLDLR